MAYDRVPRQEVWRCTREKRVRDNYLRRVRGMYEGATTRVKSSVWLTDTIPVGVRLHPGYYQIHYLLAMVIDV